MKGSSKINRPDTPAGKAGLVFWWPLVFSFGQPGIIMGMDAMKAILDNPWYIGLTIIGTVFSVAMGFHWLGGFWPRLPRLKLGPPPAKLYQMDCRYCNGSGKVKAAPLVIQPCCLCKGKGIIWTDRNGQPNCRYCNGSGKVKVAPLLIEPCSICGGIGLQKP